MGNTVIKKITWKVIEFEDFEIDSGQVLSCCPALFRTSSEASAHRAAEKH
jgi:hypothetical protein